ncbi:MAG: hypothetical protein PVI03_02045 [Candidatus Thorarchaeota archaeon]|jgi:Mg-chelatase subunit ChlD
MTKEEQDGDVVVVNKRELDYAEQMERDMEDGSFFNDWSNEDMAEFQSKMLGHDEDLRTGDAKVIGAVIKRLAEDMELVRKFNSINVLHSENKGFLACVNMHDRGLYINASNDFMTASDLVRTIRGLVLHETGHLNDYIAVPSSKEIGIKHMKQLKKAKADPGILNWVYDLEIHYQANEKGLFNQADQLALREFLSAVRGSMEKVEPNSPLLCMEDGPKNEFQEKVKAIIENRGRGVVWKAKEIDKLWKKEGPKHGQGKCKNCNGTGKTKGKDGKPEKCKECDGKGQKGGRKLTVVVVDNEQMEKLAGKHHKVKDITKKIEGEAELKELQEKVERAGISAGTIQETVRYFERIGDPIGNMEELAQSLVDMMKFDSGFLKSTTSEEKTGSRLNGIRPMRDIHEVTENVEQLVTEGKYDIESIKIPRKIKRKQKGYAFIIRDVSGSISFSDVSKVVRDATMFILSECKKAKHKVCVIDFDTDTYTLTDRDGNEISERHEELLCKSSYLKVGGGTNLGVAIDKLNILIEKEKLRDIPINVYVITDSEITRYHRIRNEFDREDGKTVGMKDMRVRHNKFTLTGLVYNTSDRGGSGSRLHVDPEFKGFIRNNGGRTFFIRLDDTRKLVKGLKSI